MWLLRTVFMFGNMQKGIVLFSVLPVRGAAAESAEMTTQLLFGETVDVLGVDGRWAHICNDYDGQSGWVDAKMITLMTDSEYDSYQSLMDMSTAFVRMPMAFAVSQNNQTTVPLTAGTKLCNYKVDEKNPQIARFEVLGVPFTIDPMMVLAQPMAINRDSMMILTRFFLNVPYLWGGKTVLGMDCSGFTQLIFSMMGKHILRNASEQATQGELIAGAEKGKKAKFTDEDLKLGRACDLAFFDHADGKITHVGILIGNGTIIHCSGRVKVERLTAEGIISSENNVLYKVGDVTHRLHSIRRY